MILSLFVANTGATCQAQEIGKGGKEIILVQL